MRLLHIVVYSVVIFILVTGCASVVAANAAVTASPCANALTWQQASKKTGSTVSVTGRVTSAHFALWKSGKGSMTFLDMGAKYPSTNRFSIVIWNRNVEKLAGKLVCARGEVGVYKGVPEMSVDNPAGLAVR
jgi:uncharacterized protein YceK